MFGIVGHEFELTYQHRPIETLDVFSHGQLNVPSGDNQLSIIISDFVDALSLGDAGGFAFPGDIVQNDGRDILRDIPQPLEGDAAFEKLLEVSLE